ncbi:hypothetical protein PsYK624_131770 [Phanerochaete sordida]|uniref:F-box domain-containing protein n=1 Tax=Phanerochaete sordida TaxID=48140 RepID=A0A9P3GK30_9APHY|nr:hypothetical protein PsYK624_131770 [Phanerochaete sordida]
MIQAEDLSTTSTIDAAIALRRQQIAALSQEIIGLQTRRNALSPLISRLPTEILAKIFFLLMLESSDEQERAGGLSSPGWLVVTRICAHWRTLALGTPHLWSYIRCFPDINLVEAFIERSRSAPLDIVGGHRDYCGRMYSMDALRLLSVEWRRIRTVRLNGDPAYMSNIEGLPFWNAPSLERISWDAPNHIEHPTDMAFLKHKEFLFLKSVQLSGFPAACGIPLLRPTLTHLSITGLATGIQVPSWLKLLGSLPLLEDLYLTGSFRMDGNARQSPVFAGQSTSLPSLSTLTLYDTSGGTGNAALLDMLDYPPCCNVWLAFYGGGHIQPSLSLEDYRCVFSTVARKLKADPRLPFWSVTDDAMKKVEFVLWKNAEDLNGYILTSGEHAYAYEKRAVFRLSFSEVPDMQSFRQMLPGLLSPLPTSGVRELYLSERYGLANSGMYAAFPHVTRLVYQSGRPDRFLERLGRRRDAEAQPMFFPALRSLTLCDPWWHQHDDSCPNPYGDPSLASDVDRMLAARESMGRPLQELYLHSVANINWPEDRPWFEDIATKSLRFTWTASTFDPDRDADSDYDDSCELCRQESGFPLFEDLPSP